MTSYPAVAAAGIELLSETFPKCFAVHEARRRPLKVGIHHDIIAALDGAMTAREVGITLQLYVRNTVYLSRLRAGARRIDLNGDPAGAVTAEEEQGAKLLLAKRQKKPPQKKPTPVPAPPQKKRIGLAGLKAAALARRAGASL